MTCGNKMTRENLLQAIYDNMDNWSCQSDCPPTMEKENPQEVCMQCANDLLAEYEKQIRADAIDVFLNNVSESIIWDVLAEVMKSNLDADDGADKIIDYLQKVAGKLKEAENGKTSNNQNNR